MGIKYHPGFSLSVLEVRGGAQSRRTILKPGCVSAASKFLQLSNGVFIPRTLRPRPSCCAVTSPLGMRGSAPFPGSLGSALGEESRGGAVARYPAELALSPHHQQRLWDLRIEPGPGAARGRARESG